MPLLFMIVSFPYLSMTRHRHAPKDYSDGIKPFRIGMCLMLPFGLRLSLLKIKVAHTSVNWLLLFLTWAVSSPLICADGLTEAQIKAAYLYNFAKFAEWPESALNDEDDILLCVVGNNVLDGAIDSLNGRQIGNHRLNVVPRDFDDSGLSLCHILFVGHSEQQRFLVLLKALNDAPVLTLSEIENFSEKGGSIGLVFRDNKVLFEINLEPIRRAGIRLPSQLLNIASYVYGN